MLPASPFGSGSATGGRLRDWLSRYGWAECAGMITAVLGAWLVRATTDNAVAAAYGGVLGENVGFYGVIVVREFLAEHRGARHAGRTLSLADILRATGGLVAEFGPAELLDSLVIRPSAMGLGAKLLGPGLGVVAGKLSADVTFYIPAVLVYERRRRRRQTR